MVLCQIAQHSDEQTRWDEVVRVDKLVTEANRIYVEEQVIPTPSSVLLKHSLLATSSILRRRSCRVTSRCVAEAEVRVAAWRASASPSTTWRRQERAERSRI